MLKFKTIKIIGFIIMSISVIGIGIMIFGIITAVNNPHKVAKELGTIVKSFNEGLEQDTTKQ